jgi:hypothetical protein
MRSRNAAIRWAPRLTTRNSVTTTDVLNVRREQLAQELGREAPGHSLDVSR